jgi:hypothetical protein
MPLAFGKLVSTSNWFAGDEDGTGSISKDTDGNSNAKAAVTIETDAPILWTVECHLY